MDSSNKKPDNDPEQNPPTPQFINGIPLIWDRKADEGLLGGLYSQNDIIIKPKK